MSDEDRLEEMLDVLEDRIEKGQPFSEEEVCRDRPDLLAELRRRAAKLRRIGRLLDGTPDDSPDELTAAGRYRPVELHAQGGLGEVFVARDDELGRKVALKRIRTREAVDPLRVRRFQFEAEITGRLDHPGVVPVYGLGRDASGRLYYAMRFIRGETLQQAIDQFHLDHPPGTDAGARAIAFQKLVRGFLSVCQTIAYAHTQSVIHRDLKPANIMLGSYGETLVVDWGLAKRLPQWVVSNAETLDSVIAATTITDQTMLGQIKGSPAYMSPEQAEGRTDQIGPRSDIYSLGATLYTLLAGKLPFENLELHQLLDHVKRGDFPRPSQVRPGVPPALEAVCLKAMSLRPADRYATALEMAADLEHWLADDPVSAWREPWTARAGRWIRKHQTIASTLAAAVLVALLGISALAAQQRHVSQIEREKRTQAEEAERNAKMLEKQARDAAERAKTSEELAKKSEKQARDAEAAAKKSENQAREAERQARRELAAFLVLSADRALDYGDRRFALDSLDQCPADLPTMDLRNIEWRLVRRRALGSRETWNPSAGAVPCVALSADGKLMAAATSDGPVRIWNRLENRTVSTLAGHARQVAFLPDNDRLLVLTVRRLEVPLRDGGSYRVNSAGEVELWSISQRKRINIVDYGVVRFVLSNDGKRMATISVDSGPIDWKVHKTTSRIAVFDMPGGKLIASTEAIPASTVDAVFSPDDRRLYAVSREVPSLLGLETLSLKPGPPMKRCLLQAWNLDGARKTMPAEYTQEGPQEADAAALAVAPDGKQVFVSDQERQIVPNGPGAWQISAGRIVIFNAADGKLVDAGKFDLFGAGAGPVPKSKRPISVESSLEEHARRLAISPDGKWVAAIVGSRVLVFDRENGKLAQAFAGHLSPPLCLVFDGDSKSLFSSGDDGLIKRWDLSHPLPDRIVIPSGQASEARGIAFSKDSRRIAVSSPDCGIAILDAATGKELIKLPPLASAVPVNDLGTALATLNTKTGAVDPLALAGSCWATDMQFSPDGGRLTAVYNDQMIAIWDISNKEPPKKPSFFILDKDLERSNATSLSTRLLLSPDGKYLASQHDGAYRVWEIAKQRLVVPHEKDEYLGMKPKMLFGASGSVFYLERTSPRAKPAVLAWDLTNGKPIDVPGVTQLVDSTEQVSRDGTRELHIVGGVVKIADRASGRDLIELVDQDAYQWAIFSPDGKYILASKNNKAELFDASPIAAPAEKP